MSADRRRLAYAFLLSLLFHALLMSLTFGGQGIGLPGFGLPWGERRVEAPTLQVQLQPLPVPAAAPAPAPLPLTPPPVATPAREVLPQVTLRPRNAAAPANATPIASKARNKAKAKAKVKGKTKTKVKVRAKVKANATAIAKAKATPKTRTNATPKVASQPRAIAEARPATASSSTALRSATPLPDDSVGSAAPRAKPEPAVIAIEPPAESTWAVPPPSPELPADNTLAANAATPLIAPPPMHEAKETAQKPVETDVPQPPAEVATHEEAVREEQRRADEVAVQRAEAAKVAAAKLEAERREAARLEAERFEAQRREAARLEAQRQEAARAEAARSEAQRVAAARAEAAKSAAAKLEAERQEAARLEAERFEAQRREAARLEAERQEVSRAEAARLEAERQEAARQAGMQRESERTGTGRRESAGQQPGGQVADRAQAELEEDARREERRRAMGRILDEEAARRQALEASRAQQPMLPLSLSTARRVRLWGRSDPNIQLVDYAEAWARRIQLNTPVESVRDLAKLPHSNPLVTVAIRSDGTIETVTIEVSSGSAAVDAAVRKIVQDTAPYPAFPPALARQYDVIEVRRTWHFDMAIRLY